MNRQIIEDQNTLSNGNCFKIVEKTKLYIDEI